MFLFGLSFLFLVLGAPIATAMGLSSLIYLVVNGINPIAVIQVLFSGIDQAAYLAIPFFILAGELINSGGITRRIVNLARKLVCNIHGGMGIAVIIACMFFAAISVSGIATVAVIGGIMYASLLRSGYSRSFAGVTVASASPIGIIIPPSIAFIIYAALAKVSIVDLYKAGFSAGIIVGLALVIPAYIIARKRKYMDRAAKIASGEIALGDIPQLDDDKKIPLLKTIWESLVALGAPVIIIGGVFAGIFTPTESAVVAVVYSILTGLFVFREMKLKDLTGIFKNAAKGSASLMIIIASASLFTYAMVIDRIPQNIFAFVQDFKGGLTVIMIFINIIILVAGIFMESGSIQYIAVPILLPIVTAMGMNPVHFGIVLIVNLAISMVTPPFGITLFASVKFFKSSTYEIMKESIPFFVSLIAALFLITYIPQLVMWIL